TSFILQFFANAVLDPSGYGQGQSLLGNWTVTTDANGDASFMATGLAPTPSGEGYFSATATSLTADGHPWNTSGFAHNIQIPGPIASAGGSYRVLVGDSLTLDASATLNPSGAPLTYSWDVNGDSVFGDASGINPTLTWSQLMALGISGPGGALVTVRVDDGHSATPSFARTTLTVVPLSSLSGTVFADFNGDGQIDFGEKGIAGVAVELTGTD